MAAFAALDASLIGQAIYALRNYERNHHDDAHDRSSSSSTSPTSTP
jgi:hypothetical protein